MRAIDAVRKDPVIVEADATITDAATVMNERVVGAVVVVDGPTVLGVLTDRDLVVRAVAAGVPVDARVDSVMSTPPVTLAASEDVRAALPIFRTHGFRRLPLLDDAGRLAGVLTVDDLLIDLTADLADVVRPITGEVVFGYPQHPMTPAPA